MVTLVSVGSIAAYAYVAALTRSAARRVRGWSVAQGGLAARWIPSLIFVPYLVIAFRPGPEIRVPVELRLFGLVLIVAGVLVAIWAAISLGPHYDLDVEIHQGHEVVRVGPYAYVRHPVYSGLILHLLGTCLATGNLILLAGILFGAIPAFVARALVEERLLVLHVGSSYELYQREVPMLLPGGRL